MFKHVIGIDVSSYQGEMDFNVAKKAGVKVAILRLGYGTVKDTLFEENYKKAREANIDLIGFYHVFYPGYDPIRQADFVNYELTLKKPDIHIFADVEIKSNISKYTYNYRLKTYLNNIKFYRKGIYTRAEFWNSYIGNQYYDWSVYPLWIARYNSVIEHPWETPPKPVSWNDFKIWQYSADGNRQGKNFGASSINIDLNRVRYGYYYLWLARKKLISMYK